MDDKILVGYKIFLLIFLLNSKYSFFISVIFMNILITRIHGFAGSNLVMSLKEHHILYGLDIITPEKEGVEKTFLGKVLNLFLSLCSECTL